MQINGNPVTYKPVKKATHIDYYDSHTIHVLLSIEGAHVFDCGLYLQGKPNADEKEVLAKVKKVKN